MKIPTENGENSPLAPEADHSASNSLPAGPVSADAKPATADTKEDLLPHHLEKLRKISRELRQQRGYQTLYRPAELDAIGYPRTQKWVQDCVPALVIPIHNVFGEVAFHQIRPDHPRTRDGKIAKYEIPSGSKMCLDVHPSILPEMANPKKPLFITEGAIKADHAISRGLGCIALIGVWNWRGANGLGGKTALPDWDQIALDGRDVYIVFDSDSQRNPQVRQALERLTLFLQARKATVHLLHLKDASDGTKVGLDDFFINGGTLADLMALEGPVPSVAECTRSRQQHQNEQRKAQVAAKAEEREVPVIETYDRQLCDLLDDFNEALVRLNQKVPILFHGPTGLSVIGKNDENYEIIVPVNRAAFQVIASKAAMWVSTLPNGNQLQVSPPTELMENFMANSIEWRVPALRSVTTSPFFDGEGLVCCEPGYHAKTQTWLQLPTGFELPDTTPTPENIEAARQLLMDKALEGVAFADAASRSHAIALMLQPLVRRMIKGATPIYLYDAPIQGSGKSYAASLSILPYAIPESMDDLKSLEEWEKVIFTAFLEGKTHLFFDNITGKLNSPTLASFVTEARKTKRLLGQNKSVTVDTRNANWVVTSNNAILSADAVSRMVKIRIDTRMETPSEKVYPADPELFIQENRAQVFGALLTLVKAWLVAERPPFTATKHRFAEWSRIMGGILEVAGIGGFLENVQAERENASPELESWRVFVQAWYAEHRSLPVTAKELLSVVDECEGISDLIGDKEAGRATRMGTQLRKVRDQTFRTSGSEGGLRIEKATARTKNGIYWQLTPLNAPQPTSDSNSATTPADLASPCDENTVVPETPMPHGGYGAASVAHLGIEDIMALSTPIKSPVAEPEPEESEPEESEPEESEPEESEPEESE